MESDLKSIKLKIFNISVTKKRVKKSDGWVVDGWVGGREQKPVQDCWRQSANVIFNDYILLIVLIEAKSHDGFNMTNHELWI